MPEKETCSQGPLIKNPSPSFLCHIDECHCLTLPAQELNVLFCLVHEILSLNSSTWLPMVPGGLGTALPNYHLQNKPIQVSAKTNYITNNNLVITYHWLLWEDFYLKRVPSNSKQSREVGSEGVHVCTGQSGAWGPEEVKQFSQNDEVPQACLTRSWLSDSQQEEHLKQTTSLRVTPEPIFLPWPQSWCVCPGEMRSKVCGVTSCCSVSWSIGYCVI